MTPPVVFESFTEVIDHDYDPAQDNDDSGDPHLRYSRAARVAAPFAPLRALMTRVETPSIVVPYVLVGEGAHDSDAVYAIKRAYARSVSGFRLRALMAKPLSVRRSWGPRFSDEFGQSHYTRSRHTLLAPYFDAFSLSLMRHAIPQISPRDRQIQLQIGWHTALYNRRMSVLYSQIRPSQLGPAQWITRADCSGSVAGGCNWAKILPRVDWRYTNTWVQIGFGKRVPSVQDAKVGDVFFYGSPSHEALYVGDGLVWSFGSYPIKILRWNYRSDFREIRRFVPL